MREGGALIGLDEIRDAVAAVAVTNGASLAVLFGSYARGAATRHSDVDALLVEQTDLPFLKRLDRHLGPLVDRLAAPVEGMVYTAAEFGGMKGAGFVKRAMEEGGGLHERGEVQEGGGAVAAAGRGGPESR